MDKIKIARVDEIGEGKTLAFPFMNRGRRSEGFLARFKGQLVAYENQCRHLPVKLEYGNGRFFTGDGEQFICQTHGATYEPLTGLCVRGPCEGQSLKRLKIEELDGEIFLLG